MVLPSWNYLRAVRAMLLRRSKGAARFCVVAVRRTFAMWTLSPKRIALGGESRYTQQFGRSLRFRGGCACVHAAPQSPQPCHICRALMRRIPQQRRQQHLGRWVPMACRGGSRGRHRLGLRRPAPGGPSSRRHPPRAGHRRALASAELRLPRVDHVMCARMMLAPLEAESCAGAVRRGQRGAGEWAGVACERRPDGC